MAHSASLKAACRAAYINNMPLTQIATAQGVPLPTLRGWKRRAAEKGDDWDKLRAPTCWRAKAWRPWPARP